MVAVVPDTDQKLGSGQNLDWLCRGLDGRLRAICLNLSYMSFNILIVDDAPFIREALRQICEQAGHWVVGEAINGHQALAMYLKYRPDVVLMDLVLPERNGVEAIEDIRKTAPQARIIACSSIDQEHLKTKAELAGAVAFLPKPFSRQQVISLIQSVGIRKELKGA